MKTRSIFPLFYKCNNIGARNCLDVCLHFWQVSSTCLTCEFHMHAFYSLHQQFIYTIISKVKEGEEKESEAWKLGVTVEADKINEGFSLIDSQYICTEHPFMSHDHQNKILISYQEHGMLRFMAQVRGRGTPLSYICSTWEVDLVGMSFWDVVRLKLLLGTW